MVQAIAGVGPNASRRPCRPCRVGFEPAEAGRRGDAHGTKRSVSPPCPTVHASPEGRTVTPCSMLEVVGPPGLGLGTRLQAAPSQCRIRVLVYPLALGTPPTAHM